MSNSLYRQYVGDFWASLFKDPGFVQSALAFFDTQEEQTLLDAQYVLDSMSRHTLHTFRDVKWRLLTVYEADVLKDPSRFDDGDVFDTGALFDGAGPSDSYFIPIPSDIWGMAFLADDVSDVTVLLQSGIDYRLDKAVSGVYTRLHPSTLGFKPEPLPGRNGPEPEMGYRMWARGVKESRGDLTRLYAETVKVLGGDGAYYKRLVNAAWNLRVDGCTLKNLRAMLCAIADADIALKAGVVQDVFSEAGRVWVRVDDDLYSGPVTSSAIVGPQASIPDGTQLFDVVQLYDPFEAIPFDEVPGLCLGNNFLGADSGSNGILVENRSLAFPDLVTLVMSTVENGRYLIDKTTDPIPVFLTGKQGYTNVELLVERADSGDEYIFVDSRLSFPFFGDPVSVAAFRTRLAELSVELGSGIGAVAVARNYGRTPDLLNLFDEYRRAMGRNLLLVRIRMDCVPAGVDPAPYVEYLRLTVPARAAIVSHMDVATTDDCPLGVVDAVDAFLEQDMSDTAPLSVTERTQGRVSI